ANSQSEPAVGFDGTNYLVFWQDNRSGGADIYGARVTPAGVVLDSAGIAISTAANSQSEPAVGFDGTNYLVVWSDNRSGGADIYGARVSPSGMVLDTSGIVISAAENNQSSPALAFDGMNFLVVWEDGRSSSSDIYGARVTPAGVVLDSAGIAISTAPRSQGSPAIVFDGSNYLVVWSDYRNVNGYADIYGARVHPTGTVLDPSGIAISTAPYDQSSPEVTFDGTNFLVVWEDQRTGVGYFPDIYGARVRQTGVVLDTSGIPISTEGNSQRYPAVGCDGMNCLVVWEDRRSGYDIYGAWLAPEGLVYDSSPVVTQEGGQFSPALKSGVGRDMLLVYQGWTGSIDSLTYNTQRIWGKVNPFVEVMERSEPDVFGHWHSATIVRRIIECQAQNAGGKLCLFDATGRLVLKLQPGVNDVTGLAPGVYIERLVSGSGSGVKGLRKLIITR
ncbi:MAG: hypothetical protein ACUVUR_04720, partial [bacterium]